MTILFYRTGDATSDVPVLGSHYRLHIWQPGADGLPPLRAHVATNLAWWALTRTGRFARRDFCELTIWRDRTLCHRLLLTPRWHRFPFMAANDLQIGAVWTAGTERRRGLARSAVAIALRRAGTAGAVWYVTEAENTGSRALAEACGMRLAASGVRTAPLGIGALGQFRIVRPA